MISHYDQYRRM